MMDTHTDFFHHIPDEVIRLIFSRISDCKTLVQCMSVSKAFHQQAVRVPSLSIVCPGNFSTYDERLLKIYTMVKAFRNLQSLVVRVGQPKEEPPSWARCMRYAEIGGSVEKFMFMAAKCGDFSELDATLLGLADMGDKSQGKAWNASELAAPLEAVVHTDMDRPDLLETSTSGISMGELDDRNTEAWSDVESDEEGGQRSLLKTTNLLNFGIIGEQKQQDKRSQYDGFTSFDASFLLEQGQRKPLSQFNLRQVIAPSNDVLKRMLPVIHFAIVQGLNELRDSLPGFVAMFAELRSFLLVDMAESITVFMREHHIQELKSLYLQDWDGETNQVKEALNVEPFFSGLGLGRGEVSSGKMVEEDPVVEGKGNRESEVRDSRHVICTEDAVDADQHGSHDKQVDDALVITQMPKDEVEESRDLTVLMNEGSCPRSRTGSSSSRVLSTCKLPLLQSVSRKALEACKGKEKLLEYQDVNLQEKGRPSASSLLRMHAGCTDFNTLPGIKEPVNGSLGGCSFLPRSQVKADREGLNATSLAGLKDGGSDAESLYQEILPAYSTAGEALLKPCTRLGPLKAFDADASISCTKEHDWSSESDTELEGTGESCVVSCERGANKQTHLSNGEGLNGKLDCQDGKRRENGYRLQGARCSRDAKADWSSKALLKRCHRSDGMKRTELSKSLQYSGGLRGFGGLFSGESVEDMDVKRSGLDKIKHLLQASAGDVCDDPLVASCSSGVGGTENGGVCDTHVSLDGDDNNNREESGNGAIIEGARQNELNVASDELMRDRQTFPWEAHENAGQRLADVDAWRHVWQERVRRLRDTLRTAPGQELGRTHEALRGRSRDRLRRHQAMEKDALSFNYTFWRAEQVSSCDYVMSDISMCIATHASQTLGDAEKEVLLRAAIAGPLLVATVSHVNKHYDCHNL